MRHGVHIAAPLLALVLAAPLAAQATEAGRGMIASVSTTSRGVLGISARQYVKDRYQGRGAGHFEASVIALEQPDRTNAHWNSRVQLAVMQVQSYECYQDDEFHPAIMAIYELGDSPAQEATATGAQRTDRPERDKIVYLSPRTILPNRWSGAVISSRTSGAKGGHYWDISLDGQQLYPEPDGFWWPYDAHNIARTSLEVRDWSSGDAMGHFADITVRTSDGSWRYFDRTMDATTGADPGPPFVVERRPHHEWFGYRVRP